MKLTCCLKVAETQWQSPEIKEKRPPQGITEPLPSLPIYFELEHLE